MRLAYADPPYPAQAFQYRGHRDYAGEVDHPALITRLCDEYPDGWALSTNAISIQYVLGLCPADVRVAAWHLTSAPPPGAAPGWHWAWEPVIVRGGRLRPVRNVLECGTALQARATLVGTKPPAFTRWMLALLGAEPDDTIDDLFPGSGAVGRAIESWRRQPELYVRRDGHADRNPKRIARDMRLAGHADLFGKAQADGESS